MTERDTSYEQLTNKDGLLVHIQEIQKFEKSIVSVFVVNKHSRKNVCPQKTSSSNPDIPRNVPNVCSRLLLHSPKVSILWDIGGLSLDDTIKSEMGHGAMGQDVGVLTPGMYNTDPRP